MFAGAGSHVAVLEGFSCSSRSCSCFKLVSWSVNCSDRGARGDFLLLPMLQQGEAVELSQWLLQIWFLCSNVGIVAALLREILGILGEARCGVRSSGVLVEKDQGACWGILGACCPLQQGMAHVLCVSPPVPAQPGDRDHPFQLRIFCESVPGWGGEFAGNSCSLEKLCPFLTVREQRVCLALQLWAPLLCR